MQLIEALPPPEPCRLGPADVVRQHPRVRVELVVRPSRHAIETSSGRAPRKRGYLPVYSSWVLRIDHPDRSPGPRLTEGVRIRGFQPGDEGQAYRVIEDAFAEWFGRSPNSFERWRALTIGREDFVPNNFLIAEQRGVIVGTALLLEDGEIWVDKLAVRRDLRNRGIARVLLAAAFARSFELGYATTGTSTDSRTGALTLYQKIGMTVREHHTHYAVDL